jgi:hypothetical protein
LRIAAAERKARLDRHGLGEMRGLRQLDRVCRRRELPGQAKALGVRAARALRLAEHAVQRIDEIDRC